MRIIGFGINEDRIRANIARRKAIEDKRDEAQAFLSNIANRTMEDERYENEREMKKMRKYEKEMKKEKDRVISKKYINGFMITHAVIFDIETLIDYGMKKVRGFDPAFEVLVKAYENMSSIVPDEIMEKARDREGYIDTERLEKVDIELNPDDENFDPDMDFTGYVMSKRTPKYLVDFSKKVMKMFKEEKKRLNL